MNWIVLTVYTFVNKPSGNIPESSNGRITGFEPVHEGSSPSSGIEPSIILQSSNGQERIPFAVLIPVENSLNPYQYESMTCQESACPKMLTTDDSKADERSKCVIKQTRRIRQPPNKLTRSRRNIGLTCAFPL